MNHKDLINLELERSFKFLWEQANTDPNSTGYGLVVDRYSRKNLSSIASVGFALSGIVIGIERGFITREQGYERAVGTLKTLRDHVPHYKGFFVHFANLNTGERHRKSEYSTIDTALAINGVIVVDSYFKDPVISELAKAIIDRVDWTHFTFDHKGKTQFRMAYNPNRDGDYGPDSNGWIHQWDMPAEQLMMYFQAAGNESVDPKLAVDLYFGFERYAGGYNDHQFVFTPGGALFIYQFSHAWFDFSKYVDAKGFDWFKNSVEATHGNREWCIDHSDQYRTFNENAWGLTACDHPYGYAAFGPAPLGWGQLHVKDNCNGTVAPYGPISSIIFTPEESIAAMEYFYNEHKEQLFGEYGFKDSYNLEEDEPWYCDEYIGIDKGITLLMLDNYLHQTTQKYYMEHPIIKRAIEVLGFKEKKNKNK